MSLSPEYASDISSEFHPVGSVNALSLSLDNAASLRRSGRARSNEQDSSPTSESKAKKARVTNLRLPRGVQRQSRNGAAYSGWVTVEGYRLLGPARPTAELASLDRERLAEAKLVGGLPEARKVIQQLHAEVASTRRIKSQYLSPNYGTGSNLSTIQLRSSFAVTSSSRMAVGAADHLPRSVAIIVPCGAREMWSFRPDKLYSSFVERTDVFLDKGVYLLEFGTIRSTIEEARRDATLTEGLGSSSSTTEGEEVTVSTRLEKEDLAELGSSGRSAGDNSQSSVWGFCAVAEVNMAMSSKVGYVGVCIFCDVILTAGPVRGTKSSAESDAFAMISEVLASGITYGASHYVMPSPNPAEDIFIETIVQDSAEESMEEYGGEEPPFDDDNYETKLTAIDAAGMSQDDDMETSAPITPSGPMPGTEDHHTITTNPN